jgi:glyoxylase-like metal-dependent hydrolase (beta-lactamase superfamily II)
MIIHPLSEGQFTVDQTKTFVPFDATQDQLTARPAGSLLVEIQPFVVITSQDVIVLDAGLGYRIGDELQLHRQLRAVGVQPEQVTKVILSHLHKDHIGGIAYADRADVNASTVWHPSFPTAMYYVQREELGYALDKPTASYLPSLLQWLSSYDRLALLDGSTQISETIRCELSGGHCPFHQVIWIAENGQTVFYGGDEAPQLQQMKHRFVAKYDKNGKKAMELRANWWQVAEKEHWTFLFYHDVTNAVFRR